MPLIHRQRGRRAPEWTGKEPPTPHQKRLLWLLDTFGKKHPEETIFTVSLLGKLFGVEARRRLGRASVGETYASIAAMYAPKQRAPLDRSGRWVLDQVIRIYRTRSYVPWSKFSAREEAEHWISGRSRHELSRQFRLDELRDAIPRIAEWVEHGGGHPAGDWRRVSRKAVQWHTELLAQQVDEIQVQLGLSQTEKVGEFADGWELVELTTTAALKAEGAIMVHCIGGYRVGQGSEYYSLRKDGHPHVTFQITNNQIRQAKGPHNVAAGLYQGNAQVAAAKTFEALGEMADLEILANTLQAITAQGWEDKNCHDLRALTRLQEILKEAHEAKAKIQGKKKGQRAEVRYPSALRYHDVKRLYRRRVGKSPKKGVDFGRLWLREEVRKGQIIYTLWPKRPSRSREAHAGRREVPEGIRPYGWTRWDNAHTFLAPEAHPVLEIWPEHWVVHFNVGFSGREFWHSASLVPLEVNMDFWQMGVKTIEVSGEALRRALPGMPIQPDLLTWKVPQCESLVERLSLTVNRQGIPIKMECSPAAYREGTLRWPAYEYAPGRWDAGPAGWRLTRRKYRAEGAPGTDYEAMLEYSRSQGWKG